MAWDKANGIYKPQINQANLVSDESSHSNSIKKKNELLHLFMVIIKDQLVDSQTCYLDLGAT